MSRPAAFEALQERHLPWIYAGFALAMGVMGGKIFLLGHETMAAFLVMGGILFGFWTHRHWQDQKRRYAENVKLLTDLEGTYGDDLPWIQVEKHFEALAKLEEELAEEDRAREVRSLYR